MWLLSTDRSELHYFARHFDVEGGYAILSHTWDKDGPGEQSLQRVRAIEERCRANGGTNPRDDPELSPKIRECCILAEKHGYRWVWIDSCCIDKTSSSELSEAINSMYKWYKASEVCFAYLKDVPNDGSDLKDTGSAFRRSRWHTRGWTLQELIAPDFVIFLSADWHELGTRAELSELLQEITRVPSGIMTGNDRPAEFSACIRMSWASSRQTTRIEDEAYSLMGLFGVSMTTNYGEGNRAFIRLQYEIMQHKECDMSLFAFGGVILGEQITDRGIVFDNKHIDRNNPWHYLLASSPRDFRIPFVYLPNIGPKAIQQYPPKNRRRSWRPFGSVELPHATVTSYGVKFRLPVATLDGVTLAVILCQTVKRHFGLFLTTDHLAKDPQRPRYFIGRSYSKSSETGSASYLCRMCDLGDDLYKLTFDGMRVKASWSTIYLVPTATDLDSESVTSPQLLINCSPFSQFHLPRSLVERFTALRFEVDEMVHNDNLQIVRFNHRSGSRIHLCIGTCKEHRDGPQEKPPLWAKIFMSVAISPGKLSHDCSEDHLDSIAWAGHSRTFGDADRMVQLSFLQSGRVRRLQGTAVVIHLELFGIKFKEMLQEADISFPAVMDSERNLQYSIPDALVTSPSPPRLPDSSLVQELEFVRDLLHRFPDAPATTLFQQIVNDLEDSQNHTPNSFLPRSRPPSHIDVVTPHSSSSRWASTTARVRTQFARFLHALPQKRGYQATAAHGNSSPVLSAGSP